VFLALALSFTTDAAKSDDASITRHDSASQSSRDSERGSHIISGVEPLAAFAGTCLVRPSPHVTQASPPTRRGS
jgi:hypothetical protein